MNNLPKAKQIEIIAALCEGVGQRAVARLTGTDRKTVARLALRVERGCAELHDRMMVGIRVNRLELDEIWSFVAKKAKAGEAERTIRQGRPVRVRRHGGDAKGNYQLPRRQARLRQHRCLCARPARARDRRARDQHRWFPALLACFDP